jgi:hypothetical protein
MQSQQLLMKSQAFKDEGLTGTESADQPAEEMSERRDHSRNHIGKSESSFAPSHSFCRCTMFWRGTAPNFGQGAVFQSEKSIRGEPVESCELRCFNSFESFLTIRGDTR